MEGGGCELPSVMEAQEESCGEGSKAALGGLRHHLAQSRRLSPRGSARLDPVASLSQFCLHREVPTQRLGHFLLMPLGDRDSSSQSCPLCQRRAQPCARLPSHTLAKPPAESRQHNPVPTELPAREPQPPAHSLSSLGPTDCSEPPLPPLQGPKPGCVLLSLEAVVAAQELLVLLVGTELDGSVGDHPDHGG